MVSVVVDSVLLQQLWTMTLRCRRGRSSAFGLMRRSIVSLLLASPIPTLGASLSCEEAVAVAVANPKQVTATAKALSTPGAPSLVRSCVSDYAAAAAAHVRAQLQTFVKPGEVCLATTLSETLSLNETGEDADGRDRRSSHSGTMVLAGHEIFVRSLRRTHPGIDLPFAVLASRATLSVTSRGRIRAMYGRTGFVEPLQPPFRLARPEVYFSQSLKVARSRGSAVRHSE